MFLFIQQIQCASVESVESFWSPFFESFIAPQKTPPNNLCVFQLFILFGNYYYYFFYHGSTICGDPVQNSNCAIRINQSQEHFNRFYSRSIL